MSWGSGHDTRTCQAARKLGCLVRRARRGARRQELLPAARYSSGATPGSRARRRGLEPDPPLRELLDLLRALGCPPRKLGERVPGGRCRHVRAEPLTHLDQAERAGGRALACRRPAQAELTGRARVRWEGGQPARTTRRGSPPDSLGHNVGHSVLKTRASEPRTRRRRSRLGRYRFRALGGRQLRSLHAEQAYSVAAEHERPFVVGHRRPAQPLEFEAEREQGSRGAVKQTLGAEALDGPLQPVLTVDPHRQRMEVGRGLQGEVGGALAGPDMLI